MTAFDNLLGTHYKNIQGVFLKTQSVWYINRVHRPQVLPAGGHFFREGEAGSSYSGPLGWPRPKGVPFLRLQWGRSGVVVSAFD